MRFRISIASCVVGLLLLACRGGSEPELPNHRPNFILLYADDQGWPGLSVQMDAAVADSKSDYYQTPNLERMAAKGMRFSRFYAGAPVCSPSRASIQTGLTTTRHGMTALAEWNPKDNGSTKLIRTPNKHNSIAERVTLPEALKSVDPRYRTAHFGKWHLESGGPEANGFDEGDGPTINTEGDVGGDNPKLTFSITRSGIDFMKRAVEADEPFYLQLSYFAVHLDMHALAETHEKYKAIPGGKKHANPLYAAMTEDLDTGVGMILDAVEELGLADNTYIVYTADNGAYVNVDQIRVKGEISSCLPLRGGKFRLYEGGIRMPTIAVGPGVAPGGITSTPLTQYDLYPTFVGLAGGAVPAELDGISFADTLRGASNNSRPLFFHYPHYNRQATPHSAVIDGDMKLLKFYEDNHVELYNVAADWGETEDLADANPGDRDRLAALLDDYLAQHEALFPEKRP